MPLKRTEDHVREERIIRRLEKEWTSTLWRPAGRSDFNAFDCIGIRDGIPRAVIEIKCRDVPSNQYDTLFLALRKAIALVKAREAVRSLGFPCTAIYVWGFNDDYIAHLQVRNLARFTMNLLGRTDRGLHNDLEPMIEVPKAHVQWLYPDPAQEAKTDKEDHLTAQQTLDELIKRFS